LGGRHGAGTSSQEHFLILVSFTSVAISAQVFPGPFGIPPVDMAPKRASGRHKPGSRTRANGHKGKSNWDGTTAAEKIERDLEEKREKVRCRAAAIKKKGIPTLSVGPKIKIEGEIKIEVKDEIKIEVEVKIEAEDNAD
jgi:hypothetical protein